MTVTVLQQISTPMGAMLGEDVRNEPQEFDEGLESFESVRECVF